MGYLKKLINNCKLHTLKSLCEKSIVLTNGNTPVVDILRFLF